MEQIIVTHADGRREYIESRQRAAKITKAQQSTALMSEDVVTLTITSAEPLACFAIGDIVTLYGRPYKVNQLPEPTKDGERQYTYDVRLEGLQYDLIDVLYQLKPDSYGDNFYADLAGHMSVLLWNIERIFPGKWALGACPTDTEYKNINASSKNALQVLQTLCDEYEVEFEITTDGSTHTIALAEKVGVTHPYTFEYGRGKGLYQLGRKNVNNAGVTTRVYFYGGTENLGSDYEHTKLCLPGTGRLTSYLQDDAAVARYGIKEGIKEYSDIKPEYTGTVTSLGEDVLTFADADMFDLNESDESGTKYLIDGTTAKVKFETGNLAGYSFDVNSYDKKTHTFKINRFTDENGRVFPDDSSAAFQFAEGNKYTIYDILPPPEYREKAEKKLLEKATEYLPTVSQPQVAYTLSITPGYLSKIFGGEHTEVLHVGDRIHIIDAALGVDKDVRITEITRDLTKVHSYDITLSDTVTKSAAVRTLNDIESIQETIKANDLADPAKARRRWMATQELLAMVFDTEGDYYSEKIKPLSIETSMLSVGAKSQQFTLRNITFTPNYGGDCNTINVTGGLLIHYAIADSAKGWMIGSATHSDLKTTSAYFIYARCSKTRPTGTIVLSEAQITVEGEDGYYHFLIGVLNSVATDEDGGRPARLVSLTYGSSTINGRFVRTGRIESSEGSCWFDLDNNEIGGVIKFVGSDGVTKDVAAVADETTALANYISTDVDERIKTLQNQVDGQIEQFFYDYDPSDDTEPTASWIEADEEDEESAEREAHLGDLFYNTDTGKVYRYVKVAWPRRPGQKRTYFYQWQELSDQELSQALELANEALDTASKKRRIFTDTPYTPYDEGDLWVQGATGGILYCASAKATGDYQEGDWKVASKYTDDSSLNEFILGTYATDIENLSDQIDGKIECWYTATDPRGTEAWKGEDSQHNGDLWFTTDNQLYRFTYANGGRSTWVQLQDADALAAQVAASGAQTTADKKRQVYVGSALPTPPYVIGDLWLREWSDGDVAKKDLFRCIKGRASGTCILSEEWAEATYYDNTQTTIDGGIVTAGTIRLANDTTQSIVAGITGGKDESASTVDDNKVRIWAGASEANRTAAPFRVTQGGKMVATNAEITGNITANDGLFKGKVSINGGTILLNKDGSGQLAGGKIWWDSKGNVTLKDITGDNINVVDGTFSGELNAAKGIRYKVAYASAINSICDKGEVVIIVNSNTPHYKDGTAITLPLDPNPGQILTIINDYNGTLNIIGLKNEIRYNTSGQQDSKTVTLGRWRSIQLVYDGNGCWYCINEREW